MGMAEKEGGLPVFDNDILNTFFFWWGGGVGGGGATAEITTRLPGKIGEHILTTERSKAI